MTRKSPPYYILFTLLVILLCFMVLFAGFLLVRRSNEDALPVHTTALASSEPEPEPEPEPDPALVQHPLQTDPQTGAYLPPAEVETPDYEYYKNLIAARKEAGMEQVISQPEGEKKIYLTFDDGPSVFTPDILQTLREKNAKATFFVIWNGNPAQQQYYRQIIEEGHELAIHTYSHVYKKVYASVDAYYSDFFRMYDFLWDLTGKSITNFRFPGGSSNTVSSDAVKTGIMEKARELGLVYYDWNVSSGDANSKKATVSQIISSVMGDAVPDGVVLMHDTAQKDTTVQALPELIDTLRNDGFTFGTVNATRDNPRQHKKLPAPEPAEPSAETPAA